MVSVVIVYLDEFEKLKNCLESVKDFQEIIIIDIGSFDSLKELAKTYQAQIYKHDFIPFVELIRDFAISKAKGDWILILDPDEQINNDLKVKLEEVIKEDKYSAVNIPRKNIFFGKWIAHSNWWPDRHIRFFKKGVVEWSKKIHSYPKVSGKVLNLPADEKLAILHYGYESIGEFIKRQNRYSKIEAEYLYQEGVRFSLVNLVWWPTREFLVRFIKHLGFLDGIHGFSLTFLMMVYRLMVSVKLWEMGRK